MAAKISNLTANSWLVKGGHEKTGLLLKKNETYVFYTSEGSMRMFSDYSKVEKYFGKLKNDEDKVSLTDNIAGYPTKHENIEMISEEPPIYKKNDSTMQFYAGYYGLKYEGGWSMVFCPKVETKNSYKSIGPYRNKIEARVEINRMNNE